MPHISIESLDHPLLEPYHDLRLRNPTRFAGYCIAEGRIVVEVLLSSKLEVRSVLVQAGREAMIAQYIPDAIDLLAVSPELIEQLVGFNFHRGVMACAVRPKPKTINDLPMVLASSRVMVATHEVQDPTNLGTMIRTAAAFGSPVMLLGRGTADPFSRRVLRVSMGNAFSMNFIDSVDLADDLRRLEQMYGIVSVAATLADDAIPLDQFRPSGPTLAVFGNEATGLPKSIEAACSARVTIPMQRGTDSLNVAVATGIFLYELSRVTTDKTFSVNTD